ncbi:hypothetical protein [Alkaliphilus transvaalensis]|uniref:hypothetical protein n=1 Tax=Alkaliphilus transvaalensis TaxID=114628 RepID=UPI00054DC85A|nr:hypothetical protein [Alkaliphilus transvaalensis]
MIPKKIHIPQMLMIGSTGRNSGKTTLAMEIVKQWQDKISVIGLKVVTIEERDGKCPRGGAGCGICLALKGNFELQEETNPNNNKDTSLLLSSGAEKVYLLKTLKEHMNNAIKSFMELINEDAMIICESNSLRKTVDPGCFLMIDNNKKSPIKRSAAEVRDMADMIIDDDIKSNLNNIMKKIIVTNTETGLTISLK